MLVSGTSNNLCSPWQKLIQSSADGLNPPAIERALITHQQFTLGDYGHSPTVHIHILPHKHAHKVSCWQLCTRVYIWSCQTWSINSTTSHPHPTTIYSHQKEDFSHSLLPIYLYFWKSTTTQNHSQNKTPSPDIIIKHIISLLHHLLSNEVSICLPPAEKIRLKLIFAGARPSLTLKLIQDSIQYNSKKKFTWSVGSLVK